MLLPHPPQPALPTLRCRWEWYGHQCMLPKWHKDGHAIYHAHGDMHFVEHYNDVGEQLFNDDPSRCDECGREYDHTNHPFA